VDADDPPSTTLFLHGGCSSPSSSSLFIHPLISPSRSPSLSLYPTFFSTSLSLVYWPHREFLHKAAFISVSNFVAVSPGGNCNSTHLLRMCVCHCAFVDMHLSVRVHLSRCIIHLKPRRLTSAVVADSYFAITGVLCVHASHACASESESVRHVSLSTFTFTRVILLLAFLLELRYQTLSTHY